LTIEFGESFGGSGPTWQKLSHIVIETWELFYMTAIVVGGANKTVDLTGMKSSSILEALQTAQA